MSEPVNHYAEQERFADLGLADSTEDHVGEDTD